MPGRDESFHQLTGASPNNPAGITSDFDARRIQDAAFPDDDDTVV